MRQLVEADAPLLKASAGLEPKQKGEGDERALAGDPVAPHLASCLETARSGSSEMCSTCLVHLEPALEAYLRQTQSTLAPFPPVTRGGLAPWQLPARMLAIFLGLTQCLGMAGAAFGSKPVHVLIDPAGSFHVAWQHVWVGFAIIGFALALTTWLVMPHDEGHSSSHHGPMSVTSLVAPFKVVVGNLQSWLAGIVGGLLFVPTTIGALVWATAFLSEGEHVPTADAASVASIVPIGWVIGCPLLGYISDRIGRRKPVLIGGALIMLAAGLVAVYVPESLLARYAVALVLGIASGAAMIPFSMIKEANPSEVKGTAAGVMNFLVFLTTGVMSPFISRLMVPANGVTPSLGEFQNALLPLVVGTAVALVLSAIMRETGTASGSWKRPAKAQDMVPVPAAQR